MSGRSRGTGSPPCAVRPGEARSFMRRKSRSPSPRASRDRGSSRRVTSRTRRRRPFRELNARSLGELLGFDSDAGGSAETGRLAVAVADRLAGEIAARFGAPLLDAPFAALGILEEEADAVASAGIP